MAKKLTWTITCGGVFALTFATGLLGGFSVVVLAQGLTGHLT